MYTKHIMENLSKYKLHLVGASKNGDKIFSTFKCNKKTIIKGMYDFNKETYIPITINTRNIPEGQTLKIILLELKKELLMEYDWEFKNIPNIITQIEINKKKFKKSKRKKHNH